MSKRGRVQSGAQRKIEEIRRQQRARQRWRRLLIGIPLVVVVAGAVTAAALLSSSSADHGNTPRPTLLANLSSMAQGRTVDGVGCDISEQTAYHIHAHLAIFVNGSRRLIPAGVGIPGGTPTPQPGGPFVGGGTCLYWLHAHDQSGVIHIESPAPKLYTLGNFFDIWGQPLTAGQVGPDNGRVTAYVNGKLYHGSPRSIVLRPHTVIQLDVGALVAPKQYSFPAGL